MASDDGECGIHESSSDELLYSNDVNIPLCNSEMSNATLMIPYKCVSMGAFIEKNFDFSVGTGGLMMLVTDFRLATTAISNTRIPEKYVHHMRSRRTMFWITPYSLFLPSTITLENFVSPCHARLIHGSFELD